MSVIDRPDTVVLDETILDDELGCEAAHNLTPVCTVKVTHLYRCCMWDKHVCTSTATAIRERARTVKWCKCGKRAEDCWRVIPI